MTAADEDLGLLVAGPQTPGYPRKTAAASRRQSVRLHVHVVASRDPIVIELGEDGVTR